MFHRLLAGLAEIPKRTFRGEFEKSEILLRLLDLDVPNLHVSPWPGLDAGQTDSFSFLNFLQNERTAQQDEHRCGKNQPSMASNRLESGFDFSPHGGGENYFCLPKALGAFSSLLLNSVR